METWIATVTSGGAQDNSIPLAISLTRHPQGVVEEQGTLRF